MSCIHNPTLKQLCSEIRNVLADMLVHQSVHVAGSSSRSLLVHRRHGGSPRASPVIDLNEACEPVQNCDKPHFTCCNSSQVCQLSQPVSLISGLWGDGNRRAPWLQGPSRLQQVKEVSDGRWCCCRPKPGENACVLGCLEPSRAIWEEEDLMAASVGPESIGISFCAPFFCDILCVLAMCGSVFA